MFELLQRMRCVDTLQMHYPGSIKSLVENFAISQGYHLTQFTKNLDHAMSPTDLSRWMDTFDGNIGGWFHRVKHGHDFAANVGDIYNRFEAKGVAKYPFELLKDASTPHGTPIPGTQFLVESGKVSSKFATDWLSVNVADVFCGGLAAYSTYKLYKKSKNNEIDEATVIWATVGVGVKVVAGVTTAQPVLILSGITDAAILISNLDAAKKAFKKLFNFVISDAAISSSMSAAVAGSSAVLTTTSLVATLGSASTGTAISSLSGAAATKATLAAIGGGSLATGGLGIAGGVALLATGGTAIAFMAGIATYKLLKNKGAD